MTAAADTGAGLWTPTDLESVAVDVALLAAELVGDEAGCSTVSGTKSSPTDVVTETDLAAEKLIRRELEQRCPGSSIVGEELAETNGSNGVGWIVDPIDGTVNFAYDLPVFSVSIAATIGGRVVAGAVADVVRGETFSAAVGAGARRDGVGIEPTAVGDLSQALVLTGFSYDAAIRATEAAILTSVLPAVRDIRCMGSAALNLCWVGCGRGEAFFERDLKVYDYAAGALIAAEAGAVVQLPAGAGLVVPGVVASTDDLVLASVAGIVAPLRTLVAEPEFDQGPLQR